MLTGPLTNGILADELLFAITDLLPLPSQMALARTCRFMNGFIKDKFFWQKKINQLEPLCSVRSILPTKNNFMHLVRSIICRFRQEVDFIGSKLEQIKLLAQFYPEVFFLIEEKLRCINILLQNINQENYLTRLFEINESLILLNTHIVELQLPISDTENPKLLKLEYITRLPDKLVATRKKIFEMIESLELKNNLLQSLPPNIKLCKKCSSLNLYNNPLRHLPDELTQLTKLVYLYLSGGITPKMPKVIYALKNLQWLSISNMHLKFISEEIANLKSLTWLYLANNDLTFLPNNFYKLRGLKFLSLDGHQLYSGQTERVIKFLQKFKIELDKLPKRKRTLKTSIDIDEMATQMQALSLTHNYSPVRFQRYQNKQQNAPDANIRRNMSFF
jgi:hypothetical protein